MRLLSLFIFFLFFSISLLAQKKLEKTLKEFNNESIPYIFIEQAQQLKNVVLLDTREKEEYAVSHLKDAIWVGYDTFQTDSIKTKIADKEHEIIVYCSIGVRSEDIGEKLTKMGYTNVKNLYGGIFEWINKGYPVFDSHGKKTEKIHAFSKQWGKLLTNGEKVYNIEK